jgi:hypothetical protein
MLTKVSCRSFWAEIAGTAIKEGEYLCGPAASCRNDLWSQHNFAAVILFFIEYLVTGSGFRQRHSMANDDFRVQLSRFDMAQ